jgi:hypothetical protein
MNCTNGHTNGHAERPPDPTPVEDDSAYAWFVGELLMQLCGFSYAGRLRVQLSLPVLTAPQIAAAPVHHPRPRGTVNQRMLELFHANPEMMNLSARRWGELLGCSSGMVAGTRAWRMIMTARALERNERLHAHSGQTT